METKPSQQTGKTKPMPVDRDNIIGNALSNSLAQSGPAGPCPSILEMAAFVDGKTAAEERQRIMGHLAGCDRCREIHLLVHDLDKAKSVQRGRAAWYLAGGALASAALVILAIKLTTPQPVSPGRQVALAPAPHRLVAPAPPLTPKPSVAPVHDQQPQPPPFSTSMAAARLARAASADSLAAAIGAPVSASHGFAGNGRRSNSFRAGQELFELKLWLAAGDRERAGLAGERLAPLLRSVAGDSVETTLENLLQRLESDENGAKLESIVSQLETMLKTGDSKIVRLGGWAAAARVAIGVGGDPYFSGNPPERFRRELGANISPEARDVLKKLSRKKTATNPEEMKRLLDELANSM